MMTEIKPTYNNIKKWSQIQENLTKSQEIFSSYIKENVRKKLLETLDLLQKDLI